MPKHFPLSPSSSYRWLNCPDSRNAPERPSNAAADAGTQAHSVAESAIRDGRFSRFDLLDLEDQVFDRTRKLVARPDARDIARAAGVYVEYVGGLAGEPVVETRIKHSKIPDFGGTIDCLLVQPGQTIIVDLKTGRWPAHAEQLMCYALLAQEVVPSPVTIATIVQPRAIDGRAVRTVSWTGSDLDAFEDQIRESAASTERHAGDWCAFCGFRPGCPVAEAAGAPNRVG